MRLLAIALLVQAVFPVATSPAQAQPGQTPYPAMARLDQYLMPDKDAEISLARSAAPASVSGEADVMVLDRDGYTSVVKGTNGFLCLVERSWGAATRDRDFWNPKTRSPICFNAAATRTYLPIYLKKTKLVLAGTSATGIVQAIATALESKELPALELGAMAYMMSKQQYLSDEAAHWHPHLMFFVQGMRRKVGEPTSPARR